MRRIQRDDGNVLLLALVLLGFLSVLAATQIGLQQQSTRQSKLFSDLSDLRRAAESGVALAIHDLRYNSNGSEGNLGSTQWTSANDLGIDGVANTADQGEGDGFPTPGEPNVVPFSLGTNGVMIEIAARVYDLGGAKQVVASSVSGDSVSVAQRILTETIASLPRTGAMYVNPSVALDLNGNAFLIDGRNHMADGRLADGGHLYGISTHIGDTPGANKLSLLSQIGRRHYDDIIGIYDGDGDGDGDADEEPSIGEVEADDVSLIADDLIAAATHTLASGTYSNLGTGVAETLGHVTYVNGDLRLTGNGSGKGVLVVDGSLTLSGQFEFTGVVVVRGDLHLTGGGAGMHILGSALVEDSVYAVDRGANVTVSGNADILYSDAILATIESSAFGSNYQPAYYDEH